MDEIIKMREQIRIAQGLTKKIKHQFPETPEGLLMFRIVDQAICDLFYLEHRVNAIKYLAGPVEAAALAGVDPEWIQYLLKKSGLLDVAEAEKTMNATRQHHRRAILERLADRNAGLA